MRRIWLVMPLPSGNNDAVTSEGIDRILAQRQNRNRNNDAGGNMRNLPRDAQPQGYFTDETQATRYAEQKARENPMRPYAVLAVSTIRETGEPQVLRKEFNSEGELILV